MIVGTEDTGNVFIRNFDQGMISALDGEVYGDQYFLDPSKVINNVFDGTLGKMNMPLPLYPDDHGIDEERGTSMPGIPIIFANSDDRVGKYVFPFIRVTAEDPSVANERWNGLHLKWKGPAPGATESTVMMGNREIKGYTRYMHQQGASPYDMPYTVTVGAAGNAATSNCDALLQYIMKKFRPQGVLRVTDSLGDSRPYTFFTEGPSGLSVIGDLTDRGIIKSLSVRVLGELDQYDPSEGRGGTILSAPVVSVSGKG